MTRPVLCRDLPGLHTCCSKPSESAAEPTHMGVHGHAAVSAAEAAVVGVDLKRLGCSSLDGNADGCCSWEAAAAMQQLGFNTATGCRESDDQQQLAAAAAVPAHAPSSAAAPTDCSNELVVPGPAAERPRCHHQRLLAAQHQQRQIVLHHSMQQWLRLVRGRALCARVFAAADSAWQQRAANQQCAHLRDFQMLRHAFAGWRQQAAESLLRVAALAAQEAAPAFRASRLKVAAWGAWRTCTQQV